MLTNNSDPQKTEGHGGSSDGQRTQTNTKPATVVLSVGEKIDVTHHFWNESSTLLNVHLNSRQGGIDATIPREHVEIVLRSEDAETEVKGV